MRKSVLEYVRKQEINSVYLIQDRNGMILVAKIKSASIGKDEDGVLVLSKPFIVAQNRMPNGSVGIALVPYMTFSNPQGADEVLFSLDAVQSITVLPKEDQLYSQYVSATSGIAIATKQPEPNKDAGFKLLKKE